MSHVPTVSVVIPVYNSEASLLPLIERLEPILGAQAAAFEVILVDDGSGDGSWKMINRLAVNYPFVRGIQLMRNYGQHNALLCGIREARHEVVVTMDDDLQNPPEEIPKLLTKLDEGYDVVYGGPAIGQHGFWRNSASRVSKIALQSALGAVTARNVSAFRAFRTKLREGFHDYRGPYVSIDVLLTWSTSRFAAVTVQHHPRRLGQSSYTFGLLLRHALNMMTGFSTLPLRLASIVGFVFTGTGLVLLLFVVGRYLLQGAAVPGFTFLASTITLLSGAQLFALGIIGEYLARIHFRMIDRPTYTILSRTLREGE